MTSELGHGTADIAALESEIIEVKKGMVEDKKEVAEVKKEITEVREEIANLNREITQVKQEKVEDKKADAEVKDKGEGNPLREGDQHYKRLFGRRLEDHEIKSLGARVRVEERRLNAQMQKICQRDRVCLLSGQAADVILTHIVSPGWSLNSEGRIGRLPKEDRDRIRTIGVYSPANAMLLSPAHAADYYEGYFAIRLNERRQYVVMAIAHSYLDFDGFVLYGGARAEEIGPGSIPPMDSGLLQFQLKCAVLRNMTASDQPEEEDHWPEYDQEMKEIEQRLHECAGLSADTVSTGLKRWVLEQFLLDLSPAT